MIYLSLPETGIFLLAAYFPVRPEVAPRNTFLQHQKNDVFHYGFGPPARIIYIPVCHLAHRKIFRVNTPPDPAKDKVRAEYFHLRANSGVFAPCPLLSCVASLREKIERIDKASPRKFAIILKIKKHLWK
jgi:hypothetical protein